MVCASRGQFLIPESDPGTAWAGEPRRCWLRGLMGLVYHPYLRLSETLRDQVPMPRYGGTWVTGGKV